jgi:hypothetical protein
MKCIDDNKKENNNQGSSNNNNGGSNREDKTYCDVPNPSNPCHDRKDYSETTGLSTCLDGSHEEDWRDCNGDSNDKEEEPNCNDVEYGTRCNGTEDEIAGLMKKQGETK